MPLRRRVGLVAAAAVGIAIVLAACACYFVVRGQLRGQVDNALRAQAATVEHNPFSLGRPLPAIPASAGGPAPYVQLVAADGSRLPRIGSLSLPVTAKDRSVASGDSGAYMTDVHVGQSHLRELHRDLLAAEHQPRDLEGELAQVTSTDVDVRHVSP